MSNIGIVAQAETNLAKDKEEKLVRYSEQVLREIEQDEALLVTVQNRIDSAKDCLDKITRGDDEFIDKVLINMTYGVNYQVGWDNATISGTIR